MPLDPINPYGSFYDYQALQAAGRRFASNNLGMSDSLSGELGAGFGGNFPSTSDFFTRQVESIRNSQLMMEAMRSDPRGGAGVDTIMAAAFGGNQRDINRFYASVPGGRASLAGAGGLLVNMPSISGFMGGDIRSIAFGAQAIAGGGMRLGGQPSFGSGVIQDQMARGIFNRTMGSFFNSAGGNITSMTSGLDMNQLGGIMGIAANQGAFNGLDMGKIESANGKFSNQFNENSLSKIKEFMKTASKTMSILVDVFGNQDMGALAGIMQRLTGLDMSSTKNMQTAMERFRNVAATAKTVGVGTGEAFRVMENISAFGVGALGMSMSGAGTASSMITPQALMFARLQQADPRFNVHPMGATDYGQAKATDLMGMLRSPNGSRAALVELMAQTGELSGSNLDKMRTMVGNASGPGGVSAFTSEFQNLTHRSVSQLLSNGRGGANIYDNMLTPESQARVLELTNKQLRPIQEAKIRRLASNQLGDGAFGNMAAGLIETFDPGTLSSMFGAGDEAGIISAALSDPGIGAGMDRSTAADYAKQVMAIRGRPGGSAGDIAGILGVVGQDALAKTYESKSRSAQVAALSAQAAIRKIGMESARRIQGGAKAGIQGLLDSFDPSSPEAMASFSLIFDPAHRHGVGIDGTFEMSLNPDQYKTVNGQLDSEGQDRLIKTMHALGFGINKQLADMLGPDPTRIGKQLWDVSSLNNLTGLDRATRAGRMANAFSNVLADPLKYMQVFQGYQRVDDPLGNSALLETKYLPSPDDAKRSLTWRALAGIPGPGGILQGGDPSLSPTERRMAAMHANLYATGGSQGISGLTHVDRSAETDAASHKFLTSVDYVMGLSDKSLAAMAKDTVAAQDAINAIESHQQRMGGLSKWQYYYRQAGKDLGIEAGTDWKIEHAKRILQNLTQNKGVASSGQAATGAITISQQSIDGIGAAVGLAVAGGARH